MRKVIITAVLLFLPLAAAALDYADVSDRYKDAPFSRPITLAVNVLTNLGVVEGDPDGGFGPYRPVNRAEFTKMAMELYFRKLKADSSSVFAPRKSCFPDILRTDIWYARAVCWAKEQGIVRGNVRPRQDPSLWRFVPERTVNYAEAVKILSLVFGFNPEEHTKLSAPATEEWYRPYVEMAMQQGLSLPGLRPDDTLSRAQVVRLAGAFMADWEGELGSYRQREVMDVAQESSLSSEESSSTSSEEFVQESSSSSSEPARLALPAESHLLLVGSVTDPLVDGMFLSSSEDSAVRQARVLLQSEVRSLDVLEVIDEGGTILGTLTPATDDPTHVHWRGEFPEDQPYRLKAGVPTRLALRARLKQRGQGGSPGELIEVEDFQVDVIGIQTGASRNIAPTEFHTPVHQVVQSKVSSIQSTMPVFGSLEAGPERQVASVSIDVTVVDGAMFVVRSVDFTVERSGVTLSGWKIGSPLSEKRSDCSVDQGQPSVITCPQIPDDLASAGTAIQFSLFATMVKEPGAEEPWFRISLGSPGAIGENGAILWNDGTTNVTWIEHEDPLMQGTRWEMR